MVEYQDDLLWGIMAATMYLALRSFFIEADHFGAIVWTGNTLLVFIHILVRTHTKEDNDDTQQH